MQEPPNSLNVRRNFWCLIMSNQTFVIKKEILKEIILKEM